MMVKFLIPASVTPICLLLRLPACHRQRLWRRTVALLRQAGRNPCGPSTFILLSLCCWGSSATNLCATPTRAKKIKSLRFERRDSLRQSIISPRRSFLPSSLYHCKFLLRTFHSLDPQRPPAVLHLL